MHHPQWIWLSAYDSCSSAEHDFAFAARRQGASLRLWVVDAEKNFSVYGLQSKQDFSVRINADNSLGEKRLEFIAELPDENDMTYNANRSHGEGYATTQLNIEGKTIDLRIDFVYDAAEDKDMLADSSIAIERIYYNGVEIKPRKTSYPQFLLTLQKDDKGDFHIVEWN